MIVAFPIEISAREYLSKIFCAYQILKNIDYRVVFGKKSEIYNFYKKIVVFILSPRVER